MKKIKITNKNFLEELSKLKTYDYQWMTSTGKVFQDIQLWGSNFQQHWIGNNPKEVYRYYKERPNRKAVFMLVGNNLKSISRGKLKNIYVSVY